VAPTEDSDAGGTTSALQDGEKIRAENDPRVPRADGHGLAQQKEA
jgi:hypothetical protein